MSEEIKSGKEILDEFFSISNLKEIPDMDEKVANVLTELYQSKKLTARNLANALSKIREESANGKD